MSLLDQVTKGRVVQNHFVLLYGVDGVGKTTFGAEAPSPVFLGPEDGLGLLETARFPTPATWADVKKAVSDLLHEDHEFKTLVIDSLDWIEPLVWAHVCKEDGVASIEQVDGGFGKGYVRAREQWIEFIKLLKRLRAKMHIIAIAHSQIRVFNDPAEDGNYDRYLLKLNEKAGDIWREAVDCVLFANFETRVTKKKGALKAKAFGDGSRVVFTERRPAFDAKNRFDLPFSMPLSWKEFADRTGSLKSTVTADDFAKLVEGLEDEATAYLREIQWIGPDDSIDALSKAKRKSICNRGDKFLEAVREFSSESETSTTTE